MAVVADKKTLGYETEVDQLLHLVVHSLYSNKEIFLRELISNASDALDKLRFEALADNSLYADDSDLKIHLEFDEAKHSITIRDNGIGMSRDEVIKNLGTIAKSGTKEFLSQINGAQKKDASHLIGQFGVGFYSAFIVAKKLVLKTRRAGAPANEAVQWTSGGESSYTIETIQKASRGTEITLYLKDDETQFANDWQLRNIVNKYSDHICWPIVMKKSPEPTPADTDTETKTEAAEPEEEVVNKAQALWTAQKSEISDDDYKALYKHISHDFEDPALWTHNHVEGKLEYISLLYIPARAPFDLWQQEVKRGLKLFVKRVFIMDDAEQFLPRYLRFVKGIIDSSDLPLNVSREILQDNKAVESIRKSSVKRILDLLAKTAENEPEKYAQFWKEFGLVMKEGPIEDFANRDKLAALLRFATTKTDAEAQTASLHDYVQRMKPGQDKIYYITAASYNTAKNSPHIEIFRKKDIEVILLYDRVDEWLVNHLSEFEGKHLQSITKGELDLGELAKSDDNADAVAEEVADKDYSSLIKHIKEVLGDKIKEARMTHRLTDSPACVVADAHDMGREMQRIMSAAGQSIPLSKPIFELNPKHPIIQKLNDETDDTRFSEWSHILFDQALLAEGAQLEDPSEFVKRLNKMLLDLAK